jgi:hypothetical protein
MKQLKAFCKVAKMPPTIIPLLNAFNISSMKLQEALPVDA